MSLTQDELRAIDQYFQDWWAAVRELASVGPIKGSDWKQRLPAPPIPLLQRAAIEHPNGRIKRHALSILDHEANDDSTETFRLALSDPSPKVRMSALHGLSCERCRVGEICTDDVVPTLIGILSNDDNPKVRQASIVALLLLADRDERVMAAIGRVADNDGDELVRRAATAARDGNYRGVKSRKAMRRANRRRGAGSGTPRPQAT